MEKFRGVVKRQQKMELTVALKTLDNGVYKSGLFTIFWGFFKQERLARFENCVENPS